MPLLSTTEIAAMRSEQNGTMPDTGIISRYTLASDSMGGQVETWAAVGTALCRLAPIGEGAERVIAERITESDPWVITFPQGTNAVARDRVSVGARTFEVKGAAEHAAWETALRVYCAEVAG